MSAGVPCTRPGEHRPLWRVTARRGNRSLFNGGRWTPSEYSEVICPACPGRWRTKAKYVDQLLDQGEPLLPSTMTVGYGGRCWCGADLGEHEGFPESGKPDPITGMHPPVRVTVQERNRWICPP